MIKKTLINLFISTLLLFNVTIVLAAENDAEMDNMEGVDHSDHGQMQHGAKSSSTSSSSREMMMGDDHMMSMQGGKAPSDARDPHAFSDGYDFGEIPRPVLGDEHHFSMLMVDRLEQVITDDNTSVAYDVQAWYGKDYNRAVLKAEGEFDRGTLQEARTELLWGHAIAAFWDTQLGVRYDYSHDEVYRAWLAFGVQGLAPYWFELDATAYVGKHGRTAIRVESEYELLITQKLILQPRVEVNVYGKSDKARGLGSGLSDISAGIRLRYEVLREFAPYIGVEWYNQFGNTKDFTKDAGGDPHEARLVAGVRLWF